MKTLFSLLLSLSSLVACGGSDFEPEPAGSLTLHATLEPTSPRVGPSTLHVHVIDAEGAAVEDATLEVVPWMPAHGHGSSDVPAVEELGDGIYVAAPITFTMPGSWEIRVKAKAAGERGETILKVEVGG